MTSYQQSISIQPIPKKHGAAIFLDRDGIINHDYEYVYKIKNFKFIADVMTSCMKFKKLGYEIIIITNQSGIARAYYKESEFKILNQWMLDQFRSQGVEITAVYYCPHHNTKGVGQFKVDCNCRKPKPGMLLQAKNDHNINLTESILIGDNITDIEAGIAAGITKNYLVNTGKEFTFDKK